MSYYSSEYFSLFPTNEIILHNHTITIHSQKINIETLVSSNPQVLFYFTSYRNTVFFVAGSCSELCVTFSHPVSVISFRLCVIIPWSFQDFHGLDRFDGYRTLIL